MKKRYWNVQELVTIGIFSAVSKVATLTVTLLSGGMNPIGLLAKNAIYTTLLMILIYKVPKVGVITVFVLVNILVSVLFFGGSIILLPSVILSAIVAEAIGKLSGGYATKASIISAVCIYDITSKGISLGISWIVLRENPTLLWLITPVVLFGYIGSIMGIFSGLYSVKELEDAGIIKG